METFEQIMQTEIKKLIGRELTQSDERMILWVSGWDAETRAGIMRLIRDAYLNGLKSSK
ncbi:hypothetical protein [Paenibacillus elgii]|uniref:hypothetical protein n=1 Tax=Paenibacillus elgii TaxID=189691 RepID=UPI00203FA9FE|nr:hypothetical protein [Paenibacillus elgii]MCM3271141.1 hypothetical protein [Paenibacillus elgii]